MTRKEESIFRSRVTAALRPLKAFAVENPILPGTPDVFYDGTTRWTYDGVYSETAIPRRHCGMLELKRGVLPVRSSTKLSVDIQPGQRPFWADAHQRGAVVRVLVQVEPRQGRGANCYLNLDPDVAASLLGTTPFDTLRAAARSWIQVFPGSDGELFRWIRRCVMV